MVVGRLGKAHLAGHQQKIELVEPTIACQMEKEVETQSSILAWRIPWTEGPGGLQSMGSQRIRHD